MVLQGEGTSYLLGKKLILLYVTYFTFFMEPQGSHPSKELLFPSYTEGKGSVSHLLPSQLHVSTTSDTISHFGPLLICLKPTCAPFWWHTDQGWVSTCFSDHLGENSGGFCYSRLNRSLQMVHENSLLKGLWCPASRNLCPFSSQPSYLTQCCFPPNRFY